MVDREAKPEVDRSLWTHVLAGVLALFIAMGVGRFAYTPILPLMQAQAHVTNSMAGYLASSNYLGYLVGAFAVGSASWFRRHRLRVYQWSLWINAFTTGAMAATENHWLWYVLRALSGLTSGFVFVVLASSMVLDELARRQRSRLSGVLYGGVGLGIAVSGLAVPVFGGAAGWRGAWLGLMILTIVIGIPAVLWMKDARDSSQTDMLQVTDRLRKLPPRTYFPWLVFAYGLEGLGYIITGTFLVALAAATPALHRFAPYSWIVVGVAAVPSCIVWAYVAQRWGHITALVAAYVFQAVGVLLPIVVPSAMGVFLGSVLFGGTFMGITTTATTLGKSLRSTDGSQAIGLMTGVYGIGQVVGAVGAGVLAHHTGGFVLPTLVSSGVLFVGSGVLIIGTIRQE
ncbi:MAG: YbfB/YjiJ family MFS transporter [Alicyclobacillus macrosporangiidus]|uniref:YbfB/YjiJ family MFS transporter n=1 Tax=Alicyclobacillus macrosporangiidus TaxID=392015 RepID=UPI0026EB44BD|nr:YbfB/YjiJ family MFS transporter [Alicyclobacillus macrosporangiidus]MCL6600889.1 YbfB/YjiJ family MFS transporter [Alicyclobacillus macrosporangiidus]